MNPDDLGLMPVEALITALEQRFDHFVFSGIKLGGEGRNDLEHRRYHGHSVYCAGLAVGLVRYIQDEEQAPPDDGGESHGSFIGEGIIE